MDQILINQSVAILCDGNNIERSIHDASKNKKFAIKVKIRETFNEVGHYIRKEILNLLFVLLQKCP